MPTPTWDALAADVYTITNRPDLVGDTAIALKLAIKAAHRQNKFWRDLVKVPIPAVTVEEVQSIDLSVSCPNFRQLAYLKVDGLDVYFAEAEVRNLLDDWNAPRTNVYWGIGDTLNFRAASPADAYEICYYLQPGTNPETLVADWLLTNYSEVPALLAASTVLANIGEQEIKQRTDQLLALALSGLIADQVEVTGR